MPSSKARPPAKFFWPWRVSLAVTTTAALAVFAALVWLHHVRIG